MRDVLDMAREAEFTEPELILMKDNFLRFAELVRKDYSITHANIWLDRIHKFMLEEREACAKFVEDEYVRQFERPWREDLAAAIRARGNVREHVMSGDCWCNPELNYTDPETGAEVWVHKEPQ